MGQMPTDRGVRLTATPLGFFVWGLNPPTSQGGGAFSPDGWTWSKANPIGPGEIVDVVAHGDHLLALGRGPGGTRMWKGQIDGEALTWSPDNTAPFRGAVAATLVADGERVIVLGWDRQTETPLWWQRDGLTWQRHAMPAAFGAFRSRLRAGLWESWRSGKTHPRRQNAGLLAPRYRRDLGARTVPGHADPDPAEPSNVWSAARRPAGVAQHRCALDGHLLRRRADHGQGLVCSCAGCYFASQGKFETEWLAQPNDRHVIHLAPIESSDWGALDGVRLHPREVSRRRSRAGWSHRPLR